MKILGIKPDSLIEWPGHLSYVIFIAGCNFQCPWCYVPHLVLPERYNKPRGISEKEVLKQIKNRENFIDAVCITGGEPTLDETELYNLLTEIKKQNPEIKIRLETNASNLEFLEKLIKQKLIDSIAVDIKNSKEKYAETCRTNINIEKINKIIQLIKNSELDYEFRTTLVPGLHDISDIKKILKWLYQDNKKIKLYVLQQFRVNLPREETRNPEFMKRGNYPFKKMQEIKQELEKLHYIERIEIRGEE